MLIWVQLHPLATMDHLGFIPQFFDYDDDRPAREQIQDRYIGGFDTFKGMDVNPDTLALQYSGDPDLPLLFQMELPRTGETVRVYDCAWVTITQPDGAWECARLD